MIEKFEKVKSIKQIGNFENEYVYDISVVDKTHTFIANELLVHNSLFVSFKPALENCSWQQLKLNVNYLSSITVPFAIVYGDTEVIEFENDNFLGYITELGVDNEKYHKLIEDYNPELIIMDSMYINNYDILDITNDYNVEWNWYKELDFIIGLDKMRYADFLRISLEEHASKYNVENRQNFELEKIVDSIINIAKKKYIQNIVYEDGVLHKSTENLLPKGVELIRSSSPAFAREKIIDIIKYLFRNPDTYNMRDLLKMVKDLKSEFILSYPDNIDDICMQSSCSNYNEKVLNDKNKLEFVDGAHFAVKAAGFYNWTLNKHPELIDKYGRLKSGDKIKYYYCKSDVGSVFAYKRGEFPIEIAPPIDFDIQFEKAILSPINSVISTINMPTISRRLTIIMDIFGDL